MKTYIFLTIAIIAWGMEYTIVKASGKISPLIIGMVMFSVSCLLLFVTSVAKGEFKSSILKNWKSMLLVGIIGSCCNLLWLAGTQLTSVANASALSRSDILFTLILSSVIFHEKIRKSSFIYIPLMLLGIAIVTELDIRKLCFNPIGDILILCSTLLLSINAFIIKKFMKEASGIILAFANCLVNSFLFTCAVMIFKPTGSLAVIPSTTWILMISCGCCSFFFFVGYYAALKMLPVWEVRLLCLGVPVVAAFAGYFILGEILNTTGLFGIAIIVLGAAGIILSSQKKFILGENLIPMAVSN